MKHFVLTPKPRSDIGHNGRIKKYPDGTSVLLVCDKPIFGLSGWEEVGKEKALSKKSKKKSKVSQGENFDRSARRARQQVRDIALCSDFDFFVTLTLDKKNIDRYNIDDILKKMRVWLDNNVRRNGLRYILIPEYHADGAIHFHGFINDVLKIKDSMHLHRITSQKIYNIESWTLGFSTAIRLYGDYPAAVNYVCKYIGKSNEKIGGRFYYSGGDLKKPEIIFVDVEDDIFDDESGDFFAIEEARLSFKSITL
jgi:hypothetical protein